MVRTAITINFPELADIVDRWRLKTVDVARFGVPPHITLLFPWKETAASDRDIGAVADLCKSTRPFKVVFSELKYFDSGVVYLSCTNDREILSLSRKIWAGFPDTPPYAGLHRNPIPHLTVAQGDTQTIECLYVDVMSDLGSGLPHSFDVNDVSILEESAQGLWHVKANIALV